MSVYTTEDRFSMTAERYLAKHNVLVYFEDAIAQLLEHKEENPKINPIKILSEYFNSLRDGNHTMFREYQFIHATPHNRASFVKLFWKCYKQIGRKGDLLSIQEYHSLVTLLCPDFPFEAVQKIARIILLDDALDCLIAFADFVYAFQVQFYYEEFLDRALEVYQSMLQTQSSPRNPVVVPSGTEDTRIHQSNHHPSDGVDAMQFFRAIYPLCDRMTYSTPPAEALKEILFNIPRVSFYGFLMSIAKSEAINEAIGRLPPKSELLECTDAELASLPVEPEVVPEPPLPIAPSAPPPVASGPVTNRYNSLVKKSTPSTRPGSKCVSPTGTPPPAPANMPTIKPSIQQQQQMQPKRPNSGARPRNLPRSHLSIARLRKRVVSSDETSDETDSDDSDDD